MPDQGGRGAHLDFQIAGGELDVFARLADEHVGEDGQRVAALHDAADGLQRSEQLAAINRFKKVVTDYQTTTHVPEALHRLVEAYLALGVKSEAKEAAAVLGYNFIVRANRMTLARLDGFAHDLFTFLVTGAKVGDTSAPAPLKRAPALQSA